MIFLVKARRLSSATSAAKSWLAWRKLADGNAPKLAISIRIPKSDAGFFAPAPTAHHSDYPKKAPAFYDYLKKTKERAQGPNQRPGPQALENGR